MARLSNNPAYLQIEDHLDSIGQKFRLVNLLRGAALFLTTLIAGTFLAAGALAILSNLNQGGRPALWMVPGVLVLGLAVAFFSWIIRPLLWRSSSLRVAEMVEAKVPGLHNSLTNSVLLVQREDLGQNAFVPHIINENLQRVETGNLPAAVRVAELRPLLLRCAGVVAACAMGALIFHQSLFHGWQQMLAPSSFIPKVGSAEIVEVRPGDTTIVFGQALEIAVQAKADANAPARIIFDGDKSAADKYTGTFDLNSQAAGLYAYRIDHVESNLKYRVEIGGTQSRWFDVKVVRQVKLQNLILDVTAPPYTRIQPVQIPLTGESIDKTPIAVAQGSVVDVSCLIDIPVTGAMMQIGDTAPVAMTAEPSKTRFSGRMIVMDDTPLSILLTETGGQIIARLPENPLQIRCTKDAPPTIEPRWPSQDVTIAPNDPIKISAMLKDDYGLKAARVLWTPSSDQPFVPAMNESIPGSQKSFELLYTLQIPENLRKHGMSIKVQVEATDNRSLGNATKDGGPQTSLSNLFEIRFRDAEKLASQLKEDRDRLRALIQEMLKTQHGLHDKTSAWTFGDSRAMNDIQAGQSELRGTMQKTAETFEFDPSDKQVQKVLQVLSTSLAKDAVEFAALLGAEKQEKQAKSLHSDLRSRQRRIISTLESLLALLNSAPEPTTQPTTRPSGDLVSKPELYKKLDEALKQFMKEEQRIMEQTAGLAKKNVDDFSDKDKKLLEELAMAQEKLDAFMQEKVNDVSKSAEQDMSNSSLLKEMLEVYSEVTMAKDALKQKAVEIAVPAEEAGVEGAKELSNNLEKWLMETPDRIKWTQEELPEKKDIPLAELPKELEDMIGELMEQQEDLFEDIEDQNANIADSLDKGAGWGAMDGPIENMSAKGVTGNTLPNNNEMGGRSGEGRSGKSRGEFVEETATGKGGRNTPTRLDPTPFEKGQVKDTSTDPVGGATGGGKMSGQGGQGLEGPVPPKVQEEMKRLAQKQAQLRNNAERLNLQYQLGRYDNFKLLESIAIMRRVESDLNANRYQSAMRRRDVLLDSMDTSHALLEGTMHVKQDTTPTGNTKVKQEINDAMKGQLPTAWSEALKEYYRKLGSE